jgi:hypothetical protein
MPLDTSFFVAMFALTAATCWGSGDFTGGLAARCSEAYRSVLGSYSVGLLALAVIALARAEALTTAADLGWGALAGLFGMLGLVFLFRGFTTGRMGIVAPGRCRAPGVALPGGKGYPGALDDQGAHDSPSVDRSRRGDPGDRAHHVVN